MSPNVLAEGARQSLQILRWQLGWIAGLAALCALIFDLRVGWSVAAGGAIGLIWTVYMAATLLRHSLNHGVRMSALSFATGWLIKVALTVALLIAAFRSGLFAPPGVLGGLFAALVAYWAKLAFVSPQKKQ